MKFSIGDKVLLKRTNEEGSVVSILSPTMMEVEVKGVHFPVYTDEVDHPYLKWFTEKKKPKPKIIEEIAVEKTKDRAKRLAQGIYISFFPVYLPGIMEDVVTHFRIHLLNETASPLHFIYEAKSATGSQLFHHKASLHAFGNVYLHTLTLEEMNDQPRFNWLLAEQTGTLISSENKGQLRIKPSRLFTQIMDIQESGSPSFSYLLSDDAAAIISHKKQELPTISITSIAQPEIVINTSWVPSEVLDLHIEMLTDQHERMSPAEMLSLQLSRLEYNVNMAVAHHQSQLIIIHGLGGGGLKAAVHTFLQQKEGVASYDDRWSARYGYGATMVTFTQ